MVQLNKLFLLKEIRLVLSTLFQVGLKKLPYFMVFEYCYCSYRPRELLNSKDQYLIVFTGISAKNSDIVKVTKCTQNNYPRKQEYHRICPFLIFETNSFKMIDHSWPICVTN